MILSLTGRLARSRDIFNCHSLGGGERDWLVERSQSSPSFQQNRSLYCYIEIFTEFVFKG